MADSTNSPAERPDSSSPGDESRNKPSKPAVDDVAALLAGEFEDDDDDTTVDDENDEVSDDSDDTDESDDGKPDESQKKGKPKTLDALAERLGIDVKELYDITLNTGKHDGQEGKDVTLGELKDLAKDSATFEVEKLDFAEQRTKQEADWLRAQQDFSALVKMLPKSAVKPELLKAIADQRLENVEVERSATLRSIPAWKDDAVEESDRKAMSEHLQTYGFGANQLELVTDNRMIKYIRDNWQREERIKAALEKVKKATKGAHKPSGKPKKLPTKKKSTRVGRRPTAQQVSDIADILKTG